jgi:uncharacterized membrane protein YgcG
MDYVLIGLAMFFVAMAVILLRNWRVYAVGIDILWDDTLGLVPYKALPSYEAMLFHPRHWHRWTKAQWVAYVERKGALRKPEPTLAEKMVAAKTVSRPAPRATAAASVPRYPRNDLYVAPAPTSARPSETSGGPGFLEASLLMSALNSNSSHASTPSRAYDSPPSGGGTFDGGGASGNWDSDSCSRSSSTSDSGSSWSSDGGSSSDSCSSSSSSD